jgi:hypothetical protein
MVHLGPLRSDGCPYICCTGRIKCCLFQLFLYVGKFEILHFALEAVHFKIALKKKSEVYLVWCPIGGGRHSGLLVTHRDFNNMSL